MRAAARWGLSPPAFDALPRPSRLEMLGWEWERERLKATTLEQWPANDWGRNLAALIMGLD